MEAAVLRTQTAVGCSNPQCGEEGLYEVHLNINDVFAERQNFDPTGHYSRPDVLKMTINKDRQHTL